jgi:hypothetical protein
MHARFHSNPVLDQQSRSRTEELIQFCSESLRKRTAQAARASLRERTASAVIAVCTSNRLNARVLICASLCGSSFGADESHSDRVQKAHRDSAHQDANNALQWPQHPPVPWKRDISVANCRVTACGEVKSRVPTGEAKPAITSRPQQYLACVQNDHCCCKSHDENRGIKES